MAGRKFGSSGSEHLTWAVNVLVPYHVARAFKASRIAVFSTGCVYPLVQASTGGSTEADPPDPVGEYAMSCLGRERVFDYFAQAQGARVVHLRLNYAAEPRYGVLHDIAGRVWRGEPVDVTTGYANVIWQGDVCRYALQSLAMAAGPAAILNVTGPETFAVREVAARFGALMGRAVRFSGVENGRGYLSNAARCFARFGPPAVTLDQLIEWTANWVKSGGASLGKPTHFETQDGRY